MPVNPIRPQCMMYNYDENGKKQMHAKEHVKGLAYIAEGYILPCCWCDQREERKDFQERGFFDERIKLINVDSLNDVLMSEPWEKWVNDVLHDPDNAPKICKDKCR